ncbi:tail fiber assembly protein [Cronobacter sakazakii]|nr:tail fiber assembly protein [Cronobacter sakazakii]
MGNGWKSFNTRTIGSSPASRSTFLHTTCYGFIYLRPETSYTVSIYQHHNYLDALEAVDTFSASDINWPVPPEV